MSESVGGEGPQIAAQHSARFQSAISGVTERVRGSFHDQQVRDPGSTFFVVEGRGRSDCPRLPEKTDELENFVAPPLQGWKLSQSPRHRPPSHGADRLHRLYSRP